MDHLNGRDERIFPGSSVSSREQEEVGFKYRQGAAGGFRVPPTRDTR